MNIFDVYSREQLEELPEDPREAFVAFVQKAEQALEERTAIERRDNSEDSWRYVQDERHGFMNVVTAAARMFGINEFVERDVPDVQNWTYDSWKQFKSDLDFFVTQMTLDVSFRSRRDSVQLSEKAKDRIRGHVFGLRECVRGANLSERKRAALLDKLAAFEVELDRSRVSILAVTRVTLEVLALGGGAWQAVDMAQRLVSNVIQEVAAAKAEDDESRRLPPFTANPAMLTAPRKARPQRGNAVPAFEDGAGGMDEDIPF